MLNNSIDQLKGIGAVKAQKFAKLGIHTWEDCLYHFPYTYIDKSVIKNASTCEDGEVCTIEGVVLSKTLSNYTKKGQQYLKIKVFDGVFEGEITFFNPRFLLNKIFIDQKYYFFGKIEKKKLTFTMMHPEFISLEKAKTDNFLKITPKYHLTQGLTNKDIENSVQQILMYNKSLIEEKLPHMVIHDNQLMPLEEAFSNIHFPKTMDLIKNARHRFIYEELFELQLKFLLIKNSAHKEESKKYKATEYISDFIRNLPFELTKGQLEAFDDIKKDMDSGFCMNRLLQGDVGSGKTIVSILSLLLCLENGMQGVYMAPTELLAFQQYNEIKKYLSDKYRIAFLSGKVKGKQRQALLEQLKEGEIDLAVGTHALIEPEVTFDRLGLVVTDEQHRFGVRQRNQLESKSTHAHVLIMSATPIPRTLSLVLYGDMNISVINQLPKSRKAIKTHYVNRSKTDAMFNFIKEAIDKGRQAYVVCPLVESSEKADLASVEKVREKLQKEIFHNYKVGMVHGKMKAKEKDEVMDAFLKNEINILVSTTVIEVGINVPNATIMVILNSERFGLSQLHQLRGRVGRGKEQSYCFLLSHKISKFSKERITTMVQTNDGFLIADKDLELRGIGDMFGTKQHGLPDFKIANIIEERALIEDIQKYMLLVIQEYQLGRNDVVDYIKRLRKTMYEDFSM